MDVDTDKPYFLVIPTLQQGGAERVISELANQFSSYLDVTVHIVVLAESVDFYNIDPRVIIHRLGFRNRGGVKRVASEVVTLLKLRRLFIRYKPACVLSFMEKYNILVLMASLFLSLRVFVSDRSNPRAKVPVYIEVLRNVLYRRATGIIAQTSLARDTLRRKTGCRNIAVIQNPLRHVCLYPEIARENIILNVGRLVPEKGHVYLLEAFSKLNDLNWKLVILGDGPLRSVLRNRIEEYGLVGRVEMPGSVKNVDWWLARSSIFAFSSISEGFPNALVEAMAAGLPCVSFDCDAGPGDIIDNEVNGVLVEVGNVSQLTLQLNRFITDVAFREAVSKEALLVREKYEMEKMAGFYFSFIRGSN